MRQSHDSADLLQEESLVKGKLLNKRSINEMHQEMISEDDGCTRKILMLEQQLNARIFKYIYDL